MPSQLHCVVGPTQAVALGDVQDSCFTSMTVGAGSPTFEFPHIRDIKSRLAEELRVRYGL